MKNHPLVDGNKRLGWLATAVFLELNGVDVTVTPADDVYRFVMEVAAGDQDVSELGRGLEGLIARRR